MEASRTKPGVVEWGSVRRGRVRVRPGVWAAAVLSFGLAPSIVPPPRAVEETVPRARAPRAAAAKQRSPVGAGPHAAGGAATTAVRVAVES